MRGLSGSKLTAAASAELAKLEAAVAAEIRSQEARLAHELEITKSLPTTPARRALIAETEALLGQTAREEV